MIVDEYLDSIERMANNILVSVDGLRKELRKGHKKQITHRELTEPCANCGMLRGSHPVPANGINFHGCSNFIPSQE